MPDTELLLKTNRVCCCFGRFIDQPLANYYAAQVTQWQEDHLPPADMTAEVSSSSDADSKSGRGTSV